RDTIKDLLPLVEPKTDRAFLDSMLEHHRTAWRKLRAYVDHVSKRRPIHPEFVAATLDELAGPDAVFSIDTGMCAVWGARYLRAAPPHPTLSPSGEESRVRGAGRRILGSFNHGSMANALPQAVGA